MIGTLLLKKGKSVSIYAIKIRQRCPVEEFLKELQVVDRNKVLSLLNRTSEHGPHGNKEKFRYLRDGIYEFKSYQVRILCAFEKDNIIILTHGFIKKKDRTPIQEIKRAKGLLKQLRAEEE